MILKQLLSLRRVSLLMNLIGKHLKPSRPRLSFPEERRGWLVLMSFLVCVKPPVSELDTGA